jgi:hypothetical protein
MKRLVEGNAKSLRLETCKRTFRQAFYLGFCPGWASKQFSELGQREQLVSNTTYPPPPAKHYLHIFSHWRIGLN